jgi:hypothetical protein
MANFEKAAVIAAPADALWAVVGNFNGISDWLPGIPQSVIVGPGTCRRHTRAEGGFVIEQLTHFDHAARTLSYRQLFAPWPQLTAYQATVRVEPIDDKRCRIIWAAEFTPTTPADEAVVREQLDYYYGKSFDGLTQLFPAAGGVRPVGPGQSIA